MSFSASTCLTNIGTTPLGGSFNIYSNIDQFSNAFLTNVSDTDLFGVNCPYIMNNIPDGTTLIRIIDTLTSCCVTITLLSNDLCTTCDLSFDLFEDNNVGRIVAGNLTGSCQNEITDYKIFWYGPNSTTQIAFTSGFGTEFEPYELTHPLTGINSPTALEGVYVPVIDKIKLDGLEFSQTGGTGYIQAELECFNTTVVTVSSFNCDNGDEEGDYTHRVNFSGASAGNDPLTLLSTFDLDTTTDYFAWKFKGYQIPDSLKITFVGSSYQEPLILEYWTIGSNVTVNIDPLEIPKTDRANEYYKKVTPLTSLTINPGDYLILEVIPNQSNPQTNWDFYFTCLDTFDCSTCLDNFLDTPYKIDVSSITQEDESCGVKRIGYTLSGCTGNELMSSDTGKYLISEGGGYTLNNSFYLMRAFNSSGEYTTNPLYFTGRTSCNISSSVFPRTCSQSNSNTISFEKSVVLGGEGQIDMFFSDLSDLTEYYDTYQFYKTSSGFIDDSSLIEYYRNVRLAIPSSSGNEICGDGTIENRYQIHFSSVIVTGTTTGGYTLSMSMPTISNNLTFTSCEENCESKTDAFVSTINNESTGTTNNFDVTTNTGSRYVRPFYGFRRVTFDVQAPNLESTLSGSYRFSEILNSTIPFSGSTYPYTPIESLTSQTCDLTSKGEFVSQGQYIYQIVYVFQYKLVVDENNLTNFEIKANPISNGVLQSTNFPDTAVTVVNGSVTYQNPLYTF